MSLAKSEGSRHSTARIWRLVRRHRVGVAILAVTSIAGALIEGFFLVVITRFALSVTDGESTVAIRGDWRFSQNEALLTAFLLVATRLGLALANVALSARLSRSTIADARRRLAAAYLSANWSSQQTQPSGRLQQILVGYAGSAAGAVTAFAGSLSAMLSLMAFIGIALALDPLATVAVVGALSVLAVVLIPLRRAIRRRAHAGARAQMDFSVSVAELGSLGMEMQTFGVRPAFESRLFDLIDRDTKAQQLTDVARGALSPVYTALAYTALLGAVAAAAAAGPGDLSSLGAVMLVMMRSLGYGQQLQVMSGNLIAYIPFLDELESTIRSFQSSPQSGGTERPVHCGAISARSVGFSYADGEPVLEDVSFDVREGEVVGIVGPSGAGKSTLVQLLLGLRDPTEGEVLVDGVDLRVVDRAYWCEKVAFVPQDANLITGTVAENLRFFRQGLCETDLKRSATEANVLREIENMPNSFDEFLGERGGNLSGGQRQRISIARALIGEPQVIILDEPTSALDGESENLIRSTLDRLSGKATIFLVAHRLSTLDICDRIMVVEHGKLTGFDTPERLQRSSTYFRHAVRQAGLGSQLLDEPEAGPTTTDDAQPD